MSRLVAWIAAVALLAAGAWYAGAHQPMESKHGRIVAIDVATGAVCEDSSVLRSGSITPPQVGAPDADWILREKQGGGYEWAPVGQKHDYRLDLDSLEAVIERGQETEMWLWENLSVHGKTPVPIEASLKDLRAAHAAQRLYLLALAGEVR